MPHVQSVPANALRRLGMTKLLAQLTILEHRIRTGWAIMATQGHSQVDGTWTLESLFLDVETYYTVAHDCLKLAAILLSEKAAVGLKREPAFRHICHLRSQMIRHAYEKPDGDPDPSMGWSPETGPRLKAGSPDRRSHDPGFFINQNGLVALLDKYQVGRFVLPGYYQQVADHLKKLTGSEDLAGYRVPQLHFAEGVRLNSDRLSTHGLPAVNVDSL
jgi:hypothetical protein